MVMIAPIYKVCGHCFGTALYLAIALITGFAFGYLLEAVGFSSSKKLTAVFYFKDMAVIKVMFSAIITALFGLTLLHSIGIMDLSKVFINPTYLYSQIIGGFIFGIGFVMGGYCPGTSIVASITGKKDAIVFAIGLLIGVYIFGESLNLKPIYNLYMAKASGLKGKITLNEVLGIGRWTLTIIIILLGLAFFAISEKIEKIRK